MERLKVDNHSPKRRGADPENRCQNARESSSRTSNTLGWIAVLLTAVFSGFCNAAIGAGGGIILTFVLATILSDRFSDRRAVLATSQAAMIPGCLLSAVIYAAEGTFDTSNFEVFAVPAILGGALGSFLLGKIKPGWINGIFSVLVIWSGCRMVV